MIGYAQPVSLFADNCFMIQPTPKFDLGFPETTHRVNLMRQDFIRHGELSRFGEWSVVDSAKLLDQVVLNESRQTRSSTWLSRLLTESSGEWKRLKIPTQKLKVQSRDAKARWEITHEIFEKSGKLLLQPDLFLSQNVDSISITVPPAELQARLMLEGARLMTGKHQIDPRLYDRDATLSELEQAVADNAWTFYCPDISDPNFKPETSLVHEAKDLPDYMRLWHDQYHAFRHACWPERYRQLLVPILQSARDVFHLDAKQQGDLAVSILSGPEPFLYRSHGFYGALLLAVSEEGLKSVDLINGGFFSNLKEWHRRIRLLTKEKRPDLLRNLDVSFLEMQTRLQRRTERNQMIDMLFF